MEKTPSRSKTPLIFGIIVALIVLGGVTVFAMNSRQQDTTTDTSTQTGTDATITETETGTETAPNSGKNMTITYTDEGFSPMDITITKGMTVTIKNESSKDAQFSSDEHPSHRDNTEMNLKTLSTGESDSYTATTVGVWKFHDHIDASQTGSVTVTE